MNSGAATEMTLAQWVDELRNGQPTHTAVVEYDVLVSGAYKLEADRYRPTEADMNAQERKARAKIEALEERVKELEARRDPTMGNWSLAECEGAVSEINRLEAENKKLRGL